MDDDSQHAIVAACLLASSKYCGIVVSDSEAKKAKERNLRESKKGKKRNGKREEIMSTMTSKKLSATLASIMAEDVRGGTGIVTIEEKMARARDYDDNDEFDMMLLDNDSSDEDYDDDGDMMMDGTNDNDIGNDYGGDGGDDDDDIDEDNNNTTATKQNVIAKGVNYLDLLLHWERIVLESLYFDLPGSDIDTTGDVRGSMKVLVPILMKRNPFVKDHKLILSAAQRLMYSSIDSNVWVIYPNVHSLASSVIVAATVLLYTANMLQFQKNKDGSFTNKGDTLLNEDDIPSFLDVPCFVDSSNNSSSSSVPALVLAVSHLLFHSQIDDRNSPAYNIIEKKNKECLLDDKRKRKKFKTDDQKKKFDKFKRTKKLNSTNIQKCVDIARRMYINCFDSVSNNSTTSSSNRITIDINERRGNIQLCKNEVGYNVIPLQKDIKSSFHLLSSSGGIKRIKTGRGPASVEGQGMIPIAACLWWDGNSGSGDGSSSSSSSSSSILNNSEGFQRQALKELRLLRTLWCEDYVPSSLWLPTGIHSNEWLTQKKTKHATTSSIISPIWFLGSPLKIRLKNIIDQKKINLIHPILFLNDLISAIRHCHSRKVVLGKHSLSTTSIYINHQNRPIIVDLSSSIFISHSIISKKIEIELKNNNKEINEKLKIKADTKMKARDLIYMPIEKMLGSTITTMSCDIWRVGMLCIHIAMGKPILSGSTCREDCLKNAYKLLGGQKISKRMKLLPWFHEIPKYPKVITEKLNKYITTFMNKKDTTWSLNNHVNNIL